MGRLSLFLYLDIVTVCPIHCLFWAANGKLPTTYYTFLGMHRLSHYLRLLLLLAPLASAGQTLQWGHPVSNLSEEFLSASKMDAAGNTYAIGNFEGTVDLDPGPLVQSFTAVGGDDMFVCKYAPSGNLLWAHTVGSTDQDFARDITIDSQGRPIITGQVHGVVDFDPGPAIVPMNQPLGATAFVWTLDTAGDYLSVSFIETTAFIWVRGIAIDDADNVTIVGDFQDSCDVDPGPGTQYLVTPNSGAAFAIQLTAAGNYSWAAALSGSHSGAEDVTVDADNNVLIVGGFSDTADFDPGPGVFNRYSNITTTEKQDVFIWKLTSSGALVWAKSINSAKHDAGRCIAVDSHNQVAIGGFFTDSADMDPGIGVVPFMATGPLDGYLLQLDENGNYVNAVSYSSALTSDVNALAVDTSNAIYVLGTLGAVNSTLTSMDMDPDTGSYILSTSSNALFVQKLHADGSLAWAHLVEGPDNNNAVDIDVADNYDIIIGGSFIDSVGIDPGPGSHFIYGNGTYNSFVAKWSQSNCPSLIVRTDSLFPITCADTIGHATVQGSGGLAPYTYLWNTLPPTSGATASFSAPGWHNVSVTDVVGCSSSVGVYVPGPLSTTGFDLSASVAGTALQPDQPMALAVTAANSGCQATPATLTLVLSPEVMYDSASIVPDFILNDTLVWDISSIHIDSGQFQPMVWVTADSSLTAAQSVCFTVGIVPESGDVEPANNVYTACFPVVNSYDPNDKMAFPPGSCNDHFVVNESSLTYLIRFQNTGNAPAVNVRIQDSLSSFLDAATVEVLGTSHPMSILEVLPGQVLNFRFNNIWLPDSMSDPAASTGFVLFTARPVNGLPSGTTVENTAEIFFDFNPAIVTNTVFQTLVDSLPVFASVSNISACAAYDWNGTTYTQNGTYSQSLVSAGGCDSTATIELELLNSSSSVALSGCANFTSPGGNQVWTASGQYTDTIPNVAGCDSVLAVDFTIINIDTALTENVGVLTANQANATYEWLDCQTSMLVPGETNQQFEPGYTSVYAAIVSLNGCLDTTSCVLVNTSGVGAALSNIPGATLMPNPVHASAIITLTQPLQNAIVTVVSVTGQTVYQAHHSRTQQIELPAEQLPAGTWIVKLQAPAQQRVWRVIKLD